MDAQKVDMFIMSNAKYFGSNQLAFVRERLLSVENEKWPMITTVQLKDPTISLIISIVAGTLGIDRFIIGDIGLGIGKLLTCGGLGIWTVIDWFFIQSATRDKNMQMMQPYLV